MKKQLALGTALWMAALLFAAGCGQAAASKTGAAGGADALSTPEAAKSNDAADVRLLTAPEGAKNTTGSEDGLYLWLDTPSGEALLYYIDYSTKQMVPLCSRPNCAHNSAECQAWTGGGAGRLFASSDGQIIYGEESVYLESSGGSYPVLWRMNPDGSERQEILRLQETEAFVDAVAGDADNIYLTVQSYDGQKSTLKISTKTNESETLFPLENSIDGTEWVYGACGGSLLISACENASQSISTFRYCLRSLSTGTDTEVYSFDFNNDTPQNTVTYANGGYFYAVAPDGSGTASVTVIDLATGIEQTTQAALDYPEGSVLSVYQAADQYLVLKLVREDGQISYPVFNTESQTAIPCPQMYVLFGSSVPKYIEASTKNQYLVIVGEETVPVVTYGMDGLPFESDMSFARYALVDKDTFFTSDAVFEEIDNIAAG